VDSSHKRFGLQEISPEPYIISIDIRESRTPLLSHFTCWQWIKVWSPEFGGPTWGVSYHFTALKPLSVTTVVILPNILEIITVQWFWVNYNDLTATSLESWSVRGIIPKLPYFRLVNYYNLHRMIKNPINQYKLAGWEFLKVDSCWLSARDFSEVWLKLARSALDRLLEGSLLTTDSTSVNATSWGLLDRQGSLHSF
jgi:hypothetical protein